MSIKSLISLLILITSAFWCNFSFAQSEGDTIRVQALNFESLTRDTFVSFPDDPNLTYEKILLKYTMRCKDGLRSTGAQRNLGCGEWDYSCNTYLIDSTKAENIPSTIASHFISDYNDSNFEYVETPVYDYIRSTQEDVQIINTITETVATIGEDTESLTEVLSTNDLAGRSQFLYTAQELIDKGLVAGDIHGLSLRVTDSGDGERFFMINMKQVDHSELVTLEEFDADAQVYYKKQSIIANVDNRFQFHTPFTWDGTSNVVVEHILTNLGSSPTETTVVGEATTMNQGLSGVNEQDVMLLNNGYIECNDYVGFGGSQNRTIEAWVKTTNGGNGEIMNWGRNVGTEKFTLRFTNGVLRVEVNGGGTVGSTRVDDGEWHHIAVVLDGDDLTGINFYIDGVLDTNSAVGTTAINTDTSSIKLRINRGLLNRYFQATIDDVRLWNTNLSEETINQWKNLKVDASHPNYENLQLFYELEESGNDIIDSSPFGRNATLIGDRYSISEVSGDALFKNFEKTNSRPSVTFFQGEYETETITTTIDRPIAQTPRHLVIERTIVPGDPSLPFDDKIVVDGPKELWLPVSNIYDEFGALIESSDLQTDGVINITDLDYIRRFPFYNELVSFVTPYGIGLDFGLEGKSWTIDMSDYVHLLKGDKRILMTLGGQWQEDMDLEFQFIVGTPPRDVVYYDQVWQGTNRIGIANINQILNDTKFAPLDLNLSADASTYKLRSSITGHGAEGEFGQNGGAISHRMSLNGVQYFNWDINQECSLNPIFPQGGTWIYDRQGWCPGEQTYTEENDITTFVELDGLDMEFDYNISSPSNTSGDYRYHVAHQVVGYGDANFGTDAAVVDVVAPNNAALYTRVGTICAEPIIMIQNTGAEELTSLTINYWLNDSQSPQTYQWTGRLEFMETEEVSIPSPANLWYDLIADNNKFYVEVSAPNGSTDEYSQNNTFNTNFEFPEIIPTDITIEFRTNNIPSQNNYRLVASDGSTVGSNNLFSGNTVYEDDFNLADGCYKLIVIDTGGDGVEWWANPGQGTGYIRIEDQTGSIIKIFEPDFGGGFEYSFSTSFPVSSEDLEFLTSIEVFPNPASDFTTVRMEDLAEARISLINAMGQTVAKPIQFSNDNEITFDTNNLETGLYYILIEKGEIVTTRKLVVE